MPIQYGPPTRIIRYGSGSAGSAPQPLLAGSFASAFSRKPAAAAKKKPASSAAPVSQTLAQVANQRVNQQLNPQIAAQNAFNAQQNQVIQNFANSLLGKLQPIAGQVGASYDSAIGQQGALANQAAQFLSNANPTGQVHDLLASINAPQEQQTQLANQFGQTFGGGAGVLSYMGGTIPGSEMAANKAAAVGEAAQLPGFAALKGQQDLASALWQQGQDRRTLEAQRPALYQAAAQDIRQNNQARQKAAAQAQQNQISNRFKAAALNQKTDIFNATQKLKAEQFTQKQGETAREFNQRLRVDKAKATVNAYIQFSKLGLSEKQLDEQVTKWSQQYDQNAQKIGISQQNANTSATRANNSAAAAAARQTTSDARLKLAQRKEAAYETAQAAKIKTAAKTKGISATSYANLRKQAIKQADLFYYGRSPKQRLVKTPAGAQKWVNTPGTGVPGIDYPVAVKQLIDGYSLTRQDAETILADFYAPGERGRPLNSAGKKAASAVGSAASAVTKGFGFGG